MNALRRLWKDDTAFVASADLILLSSLLLIGTIVGLVSFRDQIVQEFGDVAGAIGHLNQSYTFEGDGQQGDPCFVAGSSYTDELDFCDVDDPPGQPPACIMIPGVSPSSEGTAPQPNL